MNDKYRIDSHKLMYHPERVVQLINGDNAAPPIYIEVSPVGTCNHRCQFCAVDYLGYKPDRLNEHVYAEMIRHMAALGVKSIMLAGEGEPLLHNRINLMIDLAVDAGIKVAITTNGTLLHKLQDLSRIEWIKVSFNAGTRDTYAAVHGTKPSDFDLVVTNLRDAVKRKGSCTIGAQMVLLPENQHEIETLRQLGTDIGLDYIVIKPYSQHKKSITHQYENFKPEIPENDTGLIVRKAAMTTDAPSYMRCYSTPQLWAYVQSNGDVYSCSAYLGDERFKLGNINSQSFTYIWHGEKRRKNIELMASFDISECRVNCRMNQANVYLDELINGGVTHKDFI